MQQRTLGKSGYRVSEIGLGCWQLGNDFGDLSDETASAVLAAADDCAITFWDTADVYGGGLSETRIGRHRADRPGERIIATKVGRDGSLYPDGYTKPTVRSCLEGSLRRLGVEVLDLVQLHCVPDDVLRAGDLLSWLDEFRDAGLIREFGASVETIDAGAVRGAAPGADVDPDHLQPRPPGRDRRRAPGRCRQRRRGDRALAVGVGCAVGER